jgi:DNA-binding transcriptional ArsR family regulator
MHERHTHEPEDAPITGLAARNGINGRELMLLEFPPIAWIVVRYLVEGLTILAGAPKLGKSWLMLAIAVAVSAGGKVLGMDCQQGDVLYLALEDNPRRLQARLRQMRLSAWPERITFVTKWPSLDEGCLREIEMWIEGAAAPRLIVIDVFAKVRGLNTGRETQYEADYRFGAALQELAGRHGLAIVAVHHTRKMDADDPFDSVSGTRGLTGAADNVLVLKRDGGAQTPILYGRGRDMEEVETALEFDPDTCTWNAIGDAREVAKTSERQEILYILGRSVDPLTAQEVADTLGKTRSNVSHLLSRLYDEGKVQKHPRHRYTLFTPFTPFTGDASTVTAVNTVNGLHEEAA